MRDRIVVESVAALAVLVLAGCRCEKEGAATAAPSASSASATAPSSKIIRPEDLPEELRVPTAWPIPSGPLLVMVAGQGLGPIRFGATVKTIERLMEAPCEFRTEDACRYVARSVEFFLKDGVAVEMRMHRPNRSTTPKPRVFGVFNGRTEQGVAFLMLPQAVKELMGPPLRVEPVNDGGEWNTVEVHHYKGMRIEYDRLPNGNLVVGGIVITRAEPK